MTALIVVLSIISVAGIGTTAYMFLNKPVKGDSKIVPIIKPRISEDEAIKIASGKAEQILERAEQKSNSIVQSAKSEARKVRDQSHDLDRKISDRESKLIEKEAGVQTQLDKIESYRSRLEKERDHILSSRKELAKKLEEISKLTREEAEEQLKKEVEEDLNEYTAKKIREAEKKIQTDSDDKSKEILVNAMQSVATDYVGETTVSTVKIDDEKIKGRIIGKEGRNIRAFEKATGVDVIIDESPDAIAISSFDPLRRHIAVITMNMLIKDGRIHPGRIEELIEKAKSEVSKEIKKTGQLLADEADWQTIDEGLLKLLGKMKYRSSYGQTLVDHTVEVIRIGEAIAQEVKADVSLVKRACLLHDVGKVVSHKVEGQHHHISAEIARKYKLPENLVNAIEAHHLDTEAETLEAVIVYLADAISGARPGARKDSYENYVKRVKGIEDASKKIAGNKASEIYAIHAGREVRVIVKPDIVDDDQSLVLAKKISDEIEKSQTFPGTVQVTVVRESRAVSTAK
ncbi:MAG: ribonuclease Y [bacterium]